MHGNVWSLIDGTHARCSEDMIMGYESRTGKTDPLDIYEMHDDLSRLHYPRPRTDDPKPDSPENGADDQQSETRAGQSRTAAPGRDDDPLSCSGDDESGARALRFAATRAGQRANTDKHIGADATAHWRGDERETVLFD